MSGSIPGFFWPAQLGGLPHRTAGLGRCCRCPERATPANASTWSYYGDEAWCLYHAREQHEQEARG